MADQIRGGGVSESQNDTSTDNRSKQVKTGTISSNKIARKTGTTNR